MSTMTLEELQWEIKFLKAQANLLTARCQVLSAKSKAALNRREWEPLSLDQISMAWSRAYPAQPLSQAALNFARDIEQTSKERNT